MKEDASKVEAKRIWDYHKSHGRDAENPPVMLAEAHSGDAWVRVWVTGMDTMEWFYVLDSQSSDLRLIGLNLNTQSDQGLLIGDPLLADSIGQRKLTTERWQCYAHQRLSVRPR